MTGRIVYPFSPSSDHFIPVQTHTSATLYPGVASFRGGGGGGGGRNCLTAAICLTQSRSVHIDAPPTDMKPFLNRRKTDASEEERELTLGPRGETSAARDTWESVFPPLCLKSPEITSSPFRRYINASGEGSAESNLIPALQAST